MAVSDFEIRRDELERDDLQRMIGQVETALTVSAPGTRGLLEHFLQNAKMRVSSLEKKIEESAKQREEHEQGQNASAAIAERETALNEAERKTFAGFLEKSFFKKDDFPQLDEFYAKSWNRLSERGKDEMSFRVWEGVRRKEYSFDSLPEVLKDAETDRAYMHMTRGDSCSRADRISAGDRIEFIGTYERGDREGAEKILNRRTFAENISVEPPPRSDGSSRKKADLSLDGVDFSNLASDQDTLSVSAAALAPAPGSGGKKR